MMMEVRPEAMGPFVIKRRLKIQGWISGGGMLSAVVAMLATSLCTDATAPPGSVP